MASQMDWSFFCGSQSLILWEDDNIGKCFSQIVLDIPASVVLTAVSSYYIGKEYNWVIRDRAQLAVLNFRALLCLVLALVPLTSLVIKCYNRDIIFLAEIVSCFLWAFAWLSHAVYVLILKQRVSRSLRGPLLSLTAWMLTIVPCIFKLRSEASNFEPHSKAWKSPDFWLDITYISMQLLYLLSLIPHGMASVTGFDTTFQSLADETSNQRMLYNNRRFTVDFDRYYLGIAREGVTFLSRLFMSWVKPLMLKGIHIHSKHLFYFKF